MSNMVVSLLLRIREEGAGAIGKMRDQLKAIGNDSTLGESLGAALTDNLKLASTGAGELTKALGEAKEQGSKLVEKVVHGALGLGAMLYGFKKGFLEAAVSAEELRTRLEGIEQSPGRAEAALSTLREWRSETATTTADMVGAWIELREHGIRPLHSTMTSLADTAAASGRTVTEVAREFSNVISDHAIGRMRSLGVEMVNQGDRIGVRYNYLGKTIVETFSKANRTLLANGLSEILDRLHGGTAKNASEGLAGSLMRMHEAWEDFALAVMEKGGVLKYLTTQLNEFTNGGKEMADGQKSNAEALAETFKMIIRYGFQAMTMLRENLPAAIDFMKRFTEAVGGVKVVLGVVAAVMAAPFIASLFAVATGLINTAVPAVAFFATTLTTLATVMVGTVIPMIYSLGVALLTTPVGWIIMGIVALIAIGYELYKHWDEVVAFLGDLWTGFVQLLGDAWESIKSDAAKNVAAFMAAFEPIRAFFEELWGFIRKGWDNSIGLISSGIDKVRGLLPSFGGTPTPAPGPAGGVGAAGAAPARVDGTLKVDIKVDSEGRATGRVREAGATGGLELDPMLGLQGGF